MRNAKQLPAVHRPTFAGTPSQCSTKTSLGSPVQSGKGLGIGGLTVAMKWVAKGKAGSTDKCAKGDAPDTSPIVFNQDMMLIEQNLTFQQNFDPQLFDIIFEAELMEKLGYPLDDEIREVAVQKERLQIDLESIKQMLKRYEELLKNLNWPQVKTNLFN